jgi:general secretion pathway protein D
MKIEALGGSSINSIPILNNRALTSTISMPDGKMAMLAALVSRNEIRSIDGLPGISELPGFQGTDKDKELDTDELLITITPHIVRTGTFHVASKRLAAMHTVSSQ